MSEIGTLPRPRDIRGARRARNLRRVGIVGLVLLVAAGMVGLLGPRAGDVTASGGGYHLGVHHGQLTRPVAPMPFRVRVERPGGFSGPIVLELSKDLGDRLDFQTWYPSPSAESADANRLRYEFDPPDGSVFEVTLDARTAPGQPPSTSRYSVSVLEDGTAVVSVQFRMTVLP